MNPKQLYFVISCVGGVAERLQRPAPEVYHMLRDAGIIDNYILSCYDVLHTFSKEYIVNDLISLISKKGLMV